MNRDNLISVLVANTAFNRRELKAMPAGHLQKLAAMCGCSGEIEELPMPGRTHRLLSAQDAAVLHSLSAGGTLAHNAELWERYQNADSSERAQVIAHVQAVEDEAEPLPMPVW